jgi:hypothetical protein
MAAVTTITDLAQRLARISARAQEQSARLAPAVAATAPTLDEGSRMELMLRLASAQHTPLARPR